MTKKINFYRADSSLWDVVKVTCVGGLEAAHDSDGQPVYLNTHFACEHDAWEKLQRESEAFVSLSGSDVSIAKKKLLDAQIKASEAAEAYSNTTDRYRKFLLKNILKKPSKGD